ncbi:MAG: hypothetical protein L3J62_04810 [Gammaproteobacteria bacterium]|nr:hypothetical protein [Gammaproteobacteria bacterium]MCF6230106.1 hypothetical protein [Gammaproteobacteria bacterium]
MNIIVPELTTLLKVLMVQSARFGFISNLKACHRGYCGYAKDIQMKVAVDGIIL